MSSQAPEDLKQDGSLGDEEHLLETPGSLLDDTDEGHKQDASLGGGDHLPEPAGSLIDNNNDSLGVHDV